MWGSVRLERVELGRQLNPVQRLAWRAISASPELIVLFLCIASQLYDSETP